jgi:hypothetical protein
VIWTALLAGFAAIALWVSVCSSWAQERIFGPKFVEPPDESSAIAMTRDVLARLDTGLPGIDNPRFEDRCKSDKYIVMYGIDGIWEEIEGDVTVDGNQLTSNALVRNHTKDGGARILVTHSQTLSSDQLYEIWNAMEQMHPVVPPPEDQAKTSAPMMMIDGYQVEFAVCQGGNLWATEVPLPNPGSPAFKASELLRQYLDPTTPAH